MYRKLGTQINIESVVCTNMHKCAVKLNTMHDVTMFVSESVCTIIRQVYCLPHA